MKLRPEEITAILKQRIEEYEVETNLARSGPCSRSVTASRASTGWRAVRPWRMLEFEHGVTGLALNLEEDNVGAALFGDWESVKEGEVVKRTGRIASVPVGENMVGRVVDPLGQPLDGGGPIAADEVRPLEFKAPGVVHRQPVVEPLQDRPQGDRLDDSDRSRSARARDWRPLYGQDGDSSRLDHQPERRRRYLRLRRDRAEGLECRSGCREAARRRGAMDYTIVVNASASEAAPIKWMAPFAGCAMGEFFCYSGRHALVMYDDLTKHADAYRQMSLLLRRPPGREAFPGDVFYLHSRLLERACKLSDDMGGGSLTALPVIETQAGDVSAYIPTNVISITDGQIFLESDLFYSGVRPAINVGISVSRVGGNAQTKAIRKVAGRLRLDLAQYRELEAFAQFGSELDAQTQATLSRGERMVSTLNQGQYQPWPTEEQVSGVFAGIHGYLDEIPVEDIPRFHDELRESLRTEETIYKRLREEKDISDELDADLRAHIEKVAERFKVAADDATPAEASAST